jgi:hypothetical protein
VHKFVCAGWTGLGRWEYLDVMGGGGVLIGANEGRSADGFTRYVEMSYACASEVDRSDRI